MRDRRRRFALRLALELGYANPDAMLREMTAEQFDEWIAYYQLEPWGVTAHDAEWAHWKSIYVNAHLKKGKLPLKPEKFLMFGGKKKDATALFDKQDEEPWLTSETLPQN